MADDETKKDAVEETPQDEEQQDAGPDAADSTPPAEEAPEADAGDAPAAEAESAETQDEAPEADAEEAPAPEAEGDGASAEDSGSEAEQSSDDDDTPWKVKRRLEKSRRPHQPGPQLSPEERAAKRAEEQKAAAGQRRKQRAAERAKKAATGTGTPAAEREANAAKVRQGIVVSDKGEKSITVRVDIVRRHRVYEKVVRRSRTLHAHDERNEAGEGDVVLVVETRPLSKTKRWRLVEVVEKAR
jgi:small subunit ribosomal protein S17